MHAQTEPDLGRHLVGKAITAVVVFHVGRLDLGREDGVDVRVAGVARGRAEPFVFFAVIFMWHAEPDVSHYLVDGYTLGRA